MSDTLSPSVQTPPSPQASSALQSSGLPPSRRLMSLDALRGFDMFWIVGGEELVHAFYKAWPSPLFGLLNRQLNHKPWAGVAFYDLIFPLFVFIVGASLVFSLGRMLEQKGMAGTIRRILTRSLLLYCFGLLVYGGISKGWEEIRWVGVLQRIALCYLFTSLIVCAFRLRGMLIIFASLLLSYWALVTFVPVRDFNLETDHLKAQNLKPASLETRARFFAITSRVRGHFEDGLNLPQHLDFQYLPGRKWDGAYDPEGILSTLPAIGTCLLGVFAGLLLKNRNLPDQKKVLYLLVGGGASVLLGSLWGLQFPVIKKLWTSSYVLVAGGYASIFLAAFYQMVEVWNWRKWCVPFVWIGMNPITIYLAANLLPLEDLGKLVVGGPIQKSLGPWGDLLLAVTVMGLMFALVRFLYQRKIFLRL